MKRLAPILGALLCVVALGGCAGKGTLSSAIDDETGAYTVTADDAGKGASVGSIGGGIEIEEGEILVASPDLSKGSLQMRLLDAGGEVVLDEKMSGHVLSTHELSPGDYSIGVTCNEDGTTGTLLLVATDAKEFEQQNQDLEAIMSQIGNSD
ncbi:MAG: hypothetical protein IJ125_02210 [Atopobiaceae bacterium]|nr:hypothetical protein [Atopobiaceae bacterium]